MNASGSLVAHDASFARVTGPEPAVEFVVSVDAYKGPVYLAGEDARYVTSLPASGPVAVTKRIALVGERFPVGADAVSAVVAATSMPNDMTADEAGRLIICEQGACPTRPVLALSRLGRSMRLSDVLVRLQDTTAEIRVRFAVVLLVAFVAFRAGDRSRRRYRRRHLEPGRS